MKKRGVTLIELIAVMAILSALLLISFKGFKYYKNHIQNLQDILAVYDVKEFLSFSKEYCYKNESFGEIYLDCCDNFTEVYLVSKGKIIKKLDVLGKLKLINCNYVSGNKRLVMLKVNPEGYIDPFTIKLTNDKGILKKIIIQVGGNLIYIKDE